MARNKKTLLQEDKIVAERCQVILQIVYVILLVPRTLLLWYIHHKRSPQLSLIL